METMLRLAAEVLALLLSLLAALALEGLLMKLALQCMQPATADRRVAVKTPVEPGTKTVARVHARAAR